MILRVVLCFASILIFIPPALNGAEWCVDGAVAASGDGTIWATAFQMIQEGIDAASDGDTVIVAEGTYVENILFNGKNIVLRSTDPLDPTVVAATIIDGGRADSVVAFDGNEGQDCLLTGFTVQNGKAYQGGGIYGGLPLPGTRATVRGNVLTDNIATGAGGGLYACSGILEKNVICENTAIGEGAVGGGIVACNGVVQNNLLVQNSADSDGGGVYGCHGILQNNLILQNSAGRWGGGLDFCRGMLLNNTIVGNFAGDRGGGISRLEGVARNCILVPVAESVF